MAHSAYVHIPFCAHKCDFCDFTAFAGLDHLMTPYSQVVCREIEQRLKETPAERPLISVFYGGGTPGLLDAGNLALIHQSLIAEAGLAPDAEVTLETTPSSITVDKARQWLEVGINRLSIGVESLQDNELEAMGRGQGRAEAIRGIEAALSAGFSNLSCDLMYGLPEQTLESWDDTLSQILAYDLQHLSAYGLTISSNSPLLNRYPRDCQSYPDEEKFATLYELLVSKTNQSGLGQYEISNFCKPGFESVHNLAYWGNQEYYGFGVGAFRYINRVRSNNWRSMKRYMEDCISVESAEEIDDDTCKRESIFLALRTRRGLDPQEFRKLFDLDFTSQYAQSIEKLTAGGFLEWHDERFRLTQTGILISNLVMAEFM
jgi:putative oxygen-independent coproporphyrinogen III oxidase